MIMNIPENFESIGREQLGELFLDGLVERPVPVAGMLRILAFLDGGGKADVAGEWAQMARESLTAAGDRAGMLDLLGYCCGRRGAPSGQECRTAVLSVFTGKAGAALVAASGFDADVAIAECVRRLGVLSCMREGTLCSDGTWGFGIVRRVDDFYGKITIDFDKKRGHEMSFSYAAETLELLDDDHILAIKHNSPEELARLVAESPDEVVKIVLSSYGPMAIAHLREFLLGAVVPEAGWTGFWAVARKALKADPLVELPPGRKDPIRLLKREMDYGSDWLTSVESERDPETILKRCEELESALAGRAPDESFRKVLGDRLAFVISGCEKSSPGLAATAAMAAGRLGLAGDEFSAAAARFLEPGLFLGAASGLPARRIGEFLEYVMSENEDAAYSTFLSVLQEMPSTVLDETLGLMFSRDRKQECIDCLEPMLLSREAGAGILLWLCRQNGIFGGWAPLSQFELLDRVIDSLEIPGRGLGLRHQNRLRDLVEREGQLANMLEAMSIGERKRVLLKISVARGWDETWRRSLMGRIIKSYPQLEGELAGAESGAEQDVPVGRFTSWRTFRERQEQYRKLVEETIPENSREIAVARSYGDLSENHEYKAAKEHQGILLRRRGEMELDLKEVRGSDLSGFASDRVGCGTCVELIGENGERLEYCILGEWDRDEDLRIISSKSRVAELLQGRVPGDEVLLPADKGPARWKVDTVSAISADIRNWINGS